MTFTREHQRAFLTLSYDRNQLHHDPEYARRSQFGQPVFYGIGGVLFLLGKWAAGRQFLLGSLKAQFRRPLFYDQDYDVRVVEERNQVTAILQREGFPHIYVVFSWQLAEAGFELPTVAPGRFAPLTEAKRLEMPSDPGPYGTTGLIATQAVFPYEINRAALPLLERHFSLGASQFPPHQLAALLGASYFVGMECPGRQALFNEMDVKFTASAAREPFELTDLEIGCDHRFRLVRLRGKGTGIESFSASAFCRPDPVRNTLQEVKDQLSPARRFAGRTVLITGAGRGFGAVVARAFALQGARLLLNFRSQNQDSAGLLEELKAHGHEATAVYGDLSLDSGCEAVAKAIRDSQTGVDLVIHNAFPTIGTKLFREQTHEEFIGFVDLAVGTAARFFRKTLALFRPGGTIVNVSTAAVRHPEPRYSHYMTAKAATEGLMMALAREHPTLRFINVRPPRMLTDQTNLVMQPEDPCSPVQVAARLLDGLARFNETTESTNGCLELDL